MSEDKITKQWVNSAFGNQQSVTGWEIFDVLQRMKLKIVKKDAPVLDPTPSCQKVGCQAWKLLKEVEKLEARVKEQGMLIEDAYEQGFTKSVSISDLVRKPDD